MLLIYVLVGLAAFILYPEASAGLLLLVVIAWSWRFCHRVFAQYPIFGRRSTTNEPNNSDVVPTQQDNRTTSTTQTVSSEAAIHLPQMNHYNDLANDEQFLAAQRAMND